jgi:hypothetical protein
MARVYYTIHDEPSPNVRNLMAICQNEHQARDTFAFFVRVGAGMGLRRIVLERVYTDDHGVITRTERLDEAWARYA